MENNLCLSDLEVTPELDVAIDGADEIDINLSLIKGGGGCLTQEKIVASAAKNFVIIGDSSKNSIYLGEKYKKGVPVEVIPVSHKLVGKKIKDRFGGDSILRMAKAKCGPVVTDNGNFILDWVFPAEINDWTKVHTDIKLIPGVVETGLFVGMATKVYLGNPDGTVFEKTAL